MDQRSSDALTGTLKQAIKPERSTMYRIRRENVPRHHSRRRTTIPTLIIQLVLLVTKPRNIKAALSCTSDSECTALIHPNSRCVQNICNNPFASGCLRNLMANKTDGEDSNENVRVCNSDDPPHVQEKGLCRPSRFNHTELRLYPGNWETSMFFSWIVQILLSELLDVPVSIELGHGIVDNSTTKPSLNFYSEDNSFPYSTQGYNFEAIRESSQLGDCLSTQNKGTPCAHAMMEVWNGQQKKWSKANEDGYIDPPEGNGMVGKLSWFVPSFVAERDKEIVSFHGLRNQREKLAAFFKRPFTWEDYCRDLSPTNCSSTSYDGFAQRWPETKSEGEAYYMAGLYRGHFADTAKNNCTANPTSCTGHIVDAPCTWSTNTEQQTYWNNVHLESDGPLKPNGGYSYGSMIQIWKAANETKSNVIMWWWKPDGLPLDFVGSNSEFQIISLPPASKLCVENRVGPGEDGRCSDDLSVRRGDKLGGCDYDHHALQKVFSSRLYHDTYAVPPPRRSPAYDTLKSFQITDLQIEFIMKAWTVRDVDPYGFDGRDATCKWVSDHLMDLKRFIPRGYPRTLDDRNPYKEAYLYAAMVVAILVTIIVCTTAFATYYWRKTRIIRTASLPFLMLTLTGFLFVSIGAFLFAIEPSLPSCVGRQWLVTVGYTLGLVPLVVKVAAINKLDRGARRMRRVILTRKYLYTVVLSIVILAMCYLSVWQIIDRPTRKEEWSLSNEDSQLIIIDVDCSSESQVWLYLSLAWEMVLCLSACVLAFQARKVRQEFNESNLLFSIAFSHFTFMLMRTVTYVLSSTVNSNVRAAVASFMLSFDTLTAVLIYFGPKFVMIAKGGNAKKEARNTGIRSSVYISNSRSICYQDAESVQSSHRSNPERQVRFNSNYGYNDSNEDFSDSLSIIRASHPTNGRSHNDGFSVDENNSGQQSSITSPTLQEENQEEESPEQQQQQQEPPSNANSQNGHDPQQSEHQLELERVRKDAQEQIDQIKSETEHLVQRIKLDAERDVDRLKEEVKLLMKEKKNEEEKVRLTSFSICLEEGCDESEEKCLSQSSL